MILASIVKITNIFLPSFSKDIKEEIRVVFGTVTAEIMLPIIMIRLQNFGFGKYVVAMTIPTRH